MIPSAHELRATSSRRVVTAIQPDCAKAVVAHVVNTVRRAANARLTSVVVTIPRFIPDHSRYDIDQMAAHVKTVFERENYWVDVHGHGVLAIGWNTSAAKPSAPTPPMSHAPPEPADAPSW